jgi:hypothetical protein
MIWRVGDRGLTKGGHRYRILADDAKGPRGPIIALLEIAEEEMAHRYFSDGTDGGPHRAYDLGPAKVSA